MNSPTTLWFGTVDRLISGWVSRTTFSTKATAYLDIYARFACFPASCTMASAWETCCRRDEDKKQAEDCNREYFHWCCKMFSSSLRSMRDFYVPTRSVWLTLRWNSGWGLGHLNTEYLGTDRITEAWKSWWSWRGRLRRAQKSLIGHIAVRLPR